MSACLERSASLLAQCIATRDLRLGKLLHSHFIKTSLISNPFNSNRLLELYSKCDSIETAQKVFDDLPYKNSRSWNALVSGYAKNCLFDRARQLLDEMPEPGIVSYNSVISGLAHRGFYKESLCFFKKMQSVHAGLLVDEYTVVSVVSCCAHISGLRLLRQLHGIVILLGLQFDVVVCNALIDAYGKCGLVYLSYSIFCRMFERDVVSWTSMVVAFVRASKLDEAYGVFCEMPLRNCVSWSSLISGFSRNAEGMIALDLFDRMQEDGVLPSAFTYVSVLGACADLALQGKGKEFHCRIVRSINKSLLMNAYMYNALIDMYCKCGDMRSAKMLFERMPENDIVSWNSIVTGFAQNGHNEESFQTFERMIKSKVKPNHITYLGVLSACSHTGKIDEAMRIFDLMATNQVKPRSEHYAILIDLHGRNNHLDQAMELIKNLPCGSDHIGMWGALLGACRVHGNTRLARKAAEMLFNLDPSNPGRYVMLSNIYAAGKRWGDSRQVRSLMCERGLRKKAGVSWIEVKNIRHEFMVKDTSHLDREAIYDVIHTLGDQMSEMGCCPCIEIGLDDEEVCEYELSVSQTLKLN